MNKIIEDSLMRDAVEFKVGRVFLYDTKTKIEYATATVKTTEINAKADQIEVKSGKDNDITYVIDKPREVKITIEDVIMDQNLIALKMGDGLKDADSTIDGFHMPDLYAVTLSGSDKIVTLSEEPKTGEEVTFTNPITGTQISSANVTQDTTNKKIFKIVDSSIAVGDTVSVGGFKFTGKVGDKYFNLVSSSSVPELFCVVEIPLVKPDMSSLCDKLYILPRCKLSAGNDMKTESDPKEVDGKHVLTVMKPVGAKYLGTVYYKFPNALAVATPITNLAGTSTVAGKIDLTFTAPTDADNVEVQYKLSASDNWTETNIGGTTGVRVATAVSETDTSKQIIGLSSGTYDVRLVVEGGDHEGTSNSVTSIVVA
jgi:hypothetical protein